METFEICELSGIADDCKMWPVAGGSLDQSDSFLNAHRFIQVTKSRLTKHGR